MGLLEIARVGKGGTCMLPARLRRRFGLKDGSLVFAEERQEGILLRPAHSVPYERYGRRRRAEFLLSNAVDAQDYARAVEEVRRMGLDPDTIGHVRPVGD